MARKRDPEPEPVERLTRHEAAAKVVKDMLAKGVDTTIEELAERADQLFLSGNPKALPDVDKSYAFVQGQLEVLENLGLVRLAWSCAVHIENGKNGGRKNGNGNGNH